MATIIDDDRHRPSLTLRRNSAGSGAVSDSFTDRKVSSSTVTAFSLRNCRYGRSFVSSVMIFASWCWCSGVVVVEAAGQLLIRQARTQSTLLSIEGRP